MATIVKYCPMCQPRPERPVNRDPLNPKVSIPEICPSCEAIHHDLTAKLKAAKKVKVCKPGESGREKKDQQESLFNPHRKKRLYRNRSKTQPP